MNGRLTDHHRFLLRELMAELEFVESKIERLTKQIAPQVEVETVARLCTIPGVDMITAWTLLAELGSDMSVFSSPKHAASWAGLCPGNYESGGKRLSHRTRKGNRWLRRALCQSAWAASRKKNSFLAASFYRLAGKHGMRKAIVALAHRILVIAFCVLRDGSQYREVGADYFDQLHPLRTRNRLVRRLQRLGLQVILTPRPDLPELPPPPLVIRKKKGRPCKCAERLIPCITLLKIQEFSKDRLGELACIGFMVEETSVWDQRFQSQGSGSNGLSMSMLLESPSLFERLSRANAGRRPIVILPVSPAAGQRSRVSGFLLIRQVIGRFFERRESYLCFFCQIRAGPKLYTFTPDSRGVV